MTNTNGISSEERDDGVATSLPEDGDGVEEDILEQEIPSFIIDDKKKTHRRILPTAKPEKVKNTTTTTTTHHKLSAEELLLVATQIKRTSLKLKLDRDNKCSVISGVTKNDKQQGTDGANQTTINRYMNVWNSFLQFLYEIDEIDSCIILQNNNCPRDPPPVSVVAAILFLKYKVFDKDKPINHPTTNKTLCYVNGSRKGQLVVSCGSWTSQQTVAIYSAALNKLHTNNESTSGEYKEECPKCLLEKEEGKELGCTLHRGNPKFRRRGNVTNNKRFQAQITICKKHIANTYVSRKTQAWFPGEIRSIRSYLISNNSLSNTMLWTMLLFGITQGLRIDEIITMTVEQFLFELFAIKETHIQNLYHTVNGKTDGGDQDLVVWDDSYCPDMSSLRMVLLWVQLSGIKSGYLFPSLEHLADRSVLASGKHDHYCYANVLKDIKFLHYNVLHCPYSPTLIIGCHTLRKTKVLLACWGNFQTKFTQDMILKTNGQNGIFQPSIMNDLRHKTVDSLQTYISHSSTLYEFSRKHGNKESARNKVGPYMPIRIEERSCYIRQMTDMEIPQNKLSMYELSGVFLFKHVKINQKVFNQKGGYTSTLLWEKVVNYKYPSADPPPPTQTDQFFYDKIQTMMPEEEAATCIQHFETKNQSMTIHAATFLTTNSTDSNQSSKKQRTKKPEHYFRVGDHHDRWKVLRKNNPDRIRIIVDAVNYYDTECHRIQNLGGGCYGADHHKFFESINAMSFFQKDNMNQTKPFAVGYIYDKFRGCNKCSNSHHAIISNK